MKLSKLLDPVSAGSDWRELAARLGFSRLTSILELQKSPTRTLLDNYEVPVFVDCDFDLLMYTVWFLCYNENVFALFAKLSCSLVA